jgi:hypothetical protein
MSEIISNPSLERDMTDNFVCVIYFKDRNKADVRKNGMDPFVIWDILGYNAFHKNVVPIIINRLIFNNENRKFLRYNSSTQRVLLTDKGRQWADNNCRTRAGVIG